MGSGGLRGPSWVLLEREVVLSLGRGEGAATLPLWGYPLLPVRVRAEVFFQGVMRTGQRQILLWNSVLYHFATVFISHGQNQMVNTILDCKETLIIVAYSFP